MTSLDKATYINGYHPSVLKTHTWRTVENSCQHLEPTLKRLAKDSPKLAILDVGCGPGSITASLAQAVPLGAVTALDISEDALFPARSHAASLGVSNISFTAGDCHKLPFDPSTFDVVHAQQLLIHLADPVAAIKEMLRVTNPGGVVALREMDVPSMVWWPPSQGLDRWKEILFEQLRSGPGRGSNGRMVKMWCKQAGVREKDVKSTAGTWSFTTLEERAIWGGSWMDRVTDSDFATKAVSLGLATKDELVEIRNAWKAWTEDEDAWFAVMHGEALVTVR